MNKQGPILLIDDDNDDLEIFKEIFVELNCLNPIITFTSADATLSYLNENGSVNPFLIISDINLPKLSGIELRNKIHNNEQMRLRCIPYLFFTTSIAQQDVIDAYSKSIQGFFIKPNDLKELKAMLQSIITYWTFCKAPNYLRN